MATATQKDNKVTLVGDKAEITVDIETAISIISRHNNVMGK